MTADSGVDHVQAELIAMQYLQARNNILAENTMLLFMAATAFNHTAWRIVVAWLAVGISTQVYRKFRMLNRFERGVPATNFSAYWARHHAIYSDIDRRGQGRNDVPVRARGRSGVGRDDR